MRKLRKGIAIWFGLVWFGLVGVYVPMCFAIVMNFSPFNNQTKTQAQTIHDTALLYVIIQI